MLIANLVNGDKQVFILPIRNTTNVGIVEELEWCSVGAKLVVP